jgi:exopolysaccharide biosynthesis protein
MHHRRYLVLFFLLGFAGLVPAQQSTQTSGEAIADGVQLFRLDDPELLSPAGPVAVQALRIEPRKARLKIGLGNGAEPPRETVDVIAVRRPGALAAINAGFFSLQSGQPTDLLKVEGRVLNGTNRPRGAVGILDRRGVTSLLFDRLVVDTRAGVPRYTPQFGSSARDWARASDAISGAGLLMLDGREITDWTVERISAGFDTTRHPRTLIGTDAGGAIWLVTVDGRNPVVSLGMSFTELQRLARRLGLRSVLNLDGGGSTTMWVAGKIVNTPSDPGGPRKVSDAILVLPR